MNSPEFNEPSNDVDRVIREALAFETDPRRVARLERFWAEQSRKELRRRRAWQFIPAAAAAVILVVIVVLARRGVERPNAIVVEHRAPERIEVAVARDDESLSRKRSEGREPTEFERIVFLARTDSATMPTTRNKVDDVIEQIKLNRDTDVAQALKAAGIKSDDAEKALIGRLRRAKEADRSAILRLLAECGSADAIPGILRAMPRGVSSDEVLATVDKIAGMDGLAQVVAGAADLRLRTAAAERLVATNSEAGLNRYLSLVRDESTRTVALASASEMNSLPVERLLALLDDDDKSVRAAAAMVLGRANQPEVNQLLIARVTERLAESTAAWGALMASRGPMAEEFLAYAATRPQLLGYYNNARLQWAQMTP